MSWMYEMLTKGYIKKKKEKKKPQTLALSSMPLM